MKIVNHHIEGLENNIFPSKGKLDVAKYIIIHYTAGGDLEGSISNLRSKGYGYHILVDRDGTLFQGAPFNKKVYHAGCSNWMGDTNLNNMSIGICAANYGYFDLNFENQYFRSETRDTPYSREQIISKEHYVYRKYKIWEKYTPEQYQSIFQVCKALIEKYPSIINVLGHDEVSLGRKLDPGPAFEFSQIYSLFPDRDSTIEQSKYEVNSPDGVLQLRRGITRRHSKIKTLKNGEIVYLRSKVHMYKKGSGCNLKDYASVSLTRNLGHDGFVYWKYLKKIK